MTDLAPSLIGGGITGGLALVGFAFGYGKLTGAVHAFEARIAKLDGDLEDLTQELRRINETLGDRLYKVTEDLGDIRESMGRLEGRLPAQ